MKKLLVALLALSMILCMVACNNNPNETPTEAETPTQENPTEQPTEHPTEQPTEEPTTGGDTPVDQPFSLNWSKLSDLMKPILTYNDGNVINETVMFLDYGDEKELLYPIESVTSVTSYDGSKTYVEGKDYSVVGGKLKILTGSSIPCITRAKYYNTSDSTLQTKYNGSNVNTYWGEGQIMTNYQVNVNYTHDEEWEGFEQKCESDLYANFLTKLENGEDVTVFFYGDSITRGANSSWERNYAPYQYPYTILFVQALADLYGYTVEFKSSGLEGTFGSVSTAPKNYVAGNRGTITYVNTSHGGWTAQVALENFDTNVKPFINQYGCDLFICAFGINDRTTGASNAVRAMKSIVEKALALKSDASVMVVSTMVSNPNATNGWYGDQNEQEDLIRTFAREMAQNGITCSVARMTSVSESVLEYKEFQDYSGNNINHPNDFFIRLYAQTLFQTLIGYENMP